MFENRITDFYARIGFHRRKDNLTRGSYLMRVLDFAIALVLGFAFANATSAQPIDSVKVNDSVST